MKSLLSFFTLFTSLSTLICCALPALLVTLGMGAAMAGFLSQNPELIWLSENKFYLFIIGGILLLGAGYMQFQNPKECPIDKREDCENTKNISKIIYWVSVVIFIIGFSFAYILPYFL